MALRLLVTDKHYKKVNKYVNQTNLRNRLVYNLVKDTALQQYADEGTVWHKLGFLTGHPLSSWISQQVIQQYNFSCVEDDRSLERYDKAITPQGLIKNRDRHEKDDRPESNDPSRYVMGWNNEKKKEALQLRRSQLLTTLEQSTDGLLRAERRNDRLKEQVFAAKNILDHGEFRSINVPALQEAIHHIEQQSAALKKSSDQLKILTQQLEEIRSHLGRSGEEMAELEKQAHHIEFDLENREEERDSLSVFVMDLEETDKDRLLRFQQKRLSDLAVETLSADNIESHFLRFLEWAEATAKKYEEGTANEGREVDRAITRSKSPSMDILQRYTDWAADVHQLTADREFAGEYLEWLDKLQSENLPKYKRDFERLLHDTAVIKMGVLNEELEGWERKIKNSIISLNLALGGINFNRLPDTYIQLSIRPVADIDTLDGNESYRSRVLDVRNWFEFWADEKYRQTNELKKTYRQMGQLSCGEKAQLTYTILCSAIAYQFGITREGLHSKSLRFIAVDESFSNQDEEKATYLMELCKQLHLQLLVVTPSDKIQIVENFIAHVHFVQRENNRHSILLNMTKKELKEKRELLIND